MRPETATLAVVAAVLLASFAGGFAVGALSDTETVAVGIEVADDGDPGNGTAGNPGALANGTGTTVTSNETTQSTTTSTPENESTTTTTTVNSTTTTTTTDSTTTTATTEADTSS